jgi:fructose/tagatose bisphosphate aldolase
MARITLRQLLDHAADHGYGVPAFNINNMEQGLAILDWRQSRPMRPLSSRRRAGARSYANDIMLAKMMEALELMYPANSHLHPPGSRQQRRNVSLCDPERLHVSDDGWFPQGGRQDASGFRL